MPEGLSQSVPGKGHVNPEKELRCLRQQPANTGGECDIA